MPDGKQAPIPPQNLDAEESIIGAMLLSAAAIDVCQEIVRPADFYRATHGLIFEAIIALHAHGDVADPITVSDRLDALGLLEEVGGKERVHELAALVPATGNARHYAEIVVEMAKLRGLTLVGEQIQRAAWDRDGTADEIIAASEALVFALARDGAARDFATSEEIVSEVVDRLEKLAKGGAEIVGLPTGFRDVDRMTSGLRPGSLVVIAGRPSMGKTAFALGLVTDALLKSTVPVALFSFEMNRWEIMQRLLSMQALVPSDHIQTPSRMDRTDWERVMQTGGRYAAAQLFVEDNTSAGTMMDVRSKARRLKARVPALGLVVIDYLQLMEAGAKRVENRNLELGQITRGLKLMAAELQVPVMLLSQLGRDVERRHDRRPMLSDLRDSGSIEQDADIVMMLYRGEYYFPEDEALQGLAEVDIAKQRNGPTGMKKLSFVARFARFSDLPPGGVTLGNP